MRLPFPLLSPPTHSEPNVSEKISIQNGGAGGGVYYSSLASKKDQTWLNLLDPNLGSKFYKTNTTCFILKMEFSFFTLLILIASIPLNLPLIQLDLLQLPSSLQSWTIESWSRFLRRFRSRLTRSLGKVKTEVGPTKDILRTGFRISTSHTKSAPYV